MNIIAKLNEVENLIASLGYDDTVLLDKIDSKIRMIVHRVFGEHSHYLHQLDDIKYSPNFFPASNEYLHNVWGEGVGKLSNLVETIIEDVGSFSPTNSEQLQTKKTNVDGTNQRKTILFLSADPTDASRLRLGQEMRDIDNNLRMSQLRDNFELKTFTSVRPSELARAMLETCPNIVHFSGHGTADGALCFENDQGEAQLISPEALQALFAQFTDYVECVLLNACYSEIQANAIAQHTPYVIGMDTAIGDAAAIAFAVGFYQAIGAGTTIEKAFHMGKVQIMLNGIPEHLTPSLIVKPKT